MGLGTALLETGSQKTDSAVLFDTGKSDVKPGAWVWLRPLSEFLKQ